MTTFSLNPTYYQVTWTLNSPTDYSSLTGNQNGGLDSSTSWDINRLIIVTGSNSITGTPMSNGDTIVINGYTIEFTSADTLTDIINKINLVSKFTNVSANTSIAGTYITLFNRPGTEGVPFYLANGTGTALTTLGFTEDRYQNYPSEVGTAFTSVTTGSNITINGINIVFSSGTLAGAVDQLNNYAAQTSVKAYVAGPYLQMTGLNGQPWAINSGNAVTNLGTTIGNHGGYPMSLANSLAKERANMRWDQTINELESYSTPIFLGNIKRTGNIANVALTSITFTVGYEHPAQVSTIARPTEPDAGNVLVGTDAIKRSVARALTSTIATNRKVFDTTMQSYGSYTDRPNSARIQKVTASALDTVSNIAIVESNISVVQIPDV